MRGCLSLVLCDSGNMLPNGRVAIATARTLFGSQDAEGLMKLPTTQQAVSQNQCWQNERHEIYRNYGGALELNAYLVAMSGSSESRGVGRGDYGC